MDTKQIIAGSEQERQALAMMDHPHIARVLDAGAAQTGLPYFVMGWSGGRRSPKSATASACPPPDGSGRPSPPAKPCSTPPQNGFGTAVLEYTAAHHLTRLAMPDRLIAHATREKDNSPQSASTRRGSRGASRMR